MAAFKNTRFMAGVLMGMILFMGCPKPAPLPDYGSLRPEVERLYLNYHELKIVSGDLRAAIRLHIEGQGGQLGEIQNAARFIDQANLIAYYQWELLSITDYIRDDARSDFFTLRLKDIDDAHQKSKDLVLAIKVYDAFIQNPSALALIEKGVQHIEAHMDLYKTLYALMLSLANRAAAEPPMGMQESL